MRMTLSALADLLTGELEGDGDILIEGIAPLERAQAGDLTFLVERKQLARLATSGATAVLVAPDVPIDRPAIRVADPYLSFMHVLEHFYPPQAPTWGIDARAVLAPDVQLGERVYIGPYAVLCNGVRVGEDVIIHPGTYIGEACEIGDGSILYAHVSLYPRVFLGRQVIIHSGAVIGADGFGFYPMPDGSYRKIPHVGRVLIGDAVEIGANTCIDRATVGDTVIEAGAKLDNLVQVGHNSHVGQHSVLAGQAGLSGSVQVGAHVRIGGQVGVADHTTIGDKASIAAQAGVATDIAAGAAVYGTPALPGPIAKRQHFYSLRLGELFQQVKQLQRRLDALQAQE
jgi:UDP-3-O-[3-hydroxymyristoyl] glucosamine N-acyltransferase